MFPKYSNQLPRGHEALGWITYTMLNIGLILRAIAEPLQASRLNNLFVGNFTMAIGYRFYRQRLAASQGKVNDALERLVCAFLVDPSLFGIYPRRTHPGK